MVPFCKLVRGALSEWTQPLRPTRFDTTRWPRSMPIPSVFVLLSFLKLRAAFIDLPFILYLVRFDPLFHPVKPFSVSSDLPSHLAAESSTGCELLNPPAPRPCGKDLRKGSVREVHVHFTLTSMITYLFPFHGLIIIIYCKVCHNQYRILHFVIWGISTFSPFWKLGHLPIPIQPQSSSPMLHNSFTSRQKFSIEIAQSQGHRSSEFLLQ